MLKLFFTTEFYYLLPQFCLKNFILLIETSFFSFRAVNGNYYSEKQRISSVLCDFYVVKKRFYCHMNAQLYYLESPNREIQADIPIDSELFPRISQTIFHSLEGLLSTIHFYYPAIWKGSFFIVYFQN